VALGVVYSLINLLNGFIIAKRPLAQLIAIISDSVLPVNYSWQSLRRVVFCDVFIEDVERFNFDAES
jgi:hypothetical protein